MKAAPFSSPNGFLSRRKNNNVASPVVAIDAKTKPRNLRRPIADAPPSLRKTSGKLLNICLIYLIVLSLEE
ncbi:MAG: hypothetical protein AAGH89_18885, partial [Verrucomicrobiota bacterium]